MIPVSSEPEHTRKGKKNITKNNSQGSREKEKGGRDTKTILKLFKKLHRSYKSRAYER